MTTYNTNFGSYTAGAQPSDWTARWVTTNATWLATTVANTDGGKVLRKTSTAGARRLLSWDAVDGDANRADCEILARARLATGGDQVRLHLRASGAAASETAYSFLMGSVVLHKYVAGVSTNLATGTYSYFINTWYLIRFRVNGTTLSVKVWPDGVAEPSDWTLTATDSEISAAGWVGVGNFDSASTMDIDYVSIGTNGATAPQISPGNTAAISQAVVEVANAGTPSAVISQAAVEVALYGTPSALLSSLVIEVAVANVVATVQQPIVTVVC